jgi:homoserine dehydrogenase
LIIKDSYLANVDGVLNAVLVDGLPVGNTILQGEGAGPGPTSSALISDLCSLLRGKLKFPFGISSKFRKKISCFNILERSCSSYLRIEVKDLPGVLSSITKIFANNYISIKNLVQNPDKKNKRASIIIITHKTSEKNYSKLLNILTKNKFVIKKPTFIRVESN